MKKKYSKYIGLFASVLFFGLIVYYFSTIFTWIVLAWVFSLLGSPIMKMLRGIKIKKWSLPPALCAVLVIFFFYGLLIGFVSIFAPIILQQGRNLAKVDYNNILDSLEEPIAHFNEWMVEKGLTEVPVEIPIPDSTSLLGEMIVDPTKNAPKEPQVITKTIRMDSLLNPAGDIASQTNISLDLQILLPAESNNKNANTIFQEYKEGVDASPMTKIKKQALEYISPSKIITNTVLFAVNLFGNFLVLLSSVTFITFFFLKDEKLFGNALKKVMPRRHFNRTDTALQNVKHLLSRYFGGVFLQVIVITVFLTGLLSLFGVPNSFLIGFFAALINIIPYIGPMIGAAFAVMVTISSNLEADFYMDTLPMLYSVLITFAVMQAGDNFILQPYIFSNSVSAHPLEIFIVVVAGAQIGGITGMVIAIPTYTIIRVIAAVFLHEFAIVRKLTDTFSEEAHIDVEVKDTPPKRRPPAPES